MEPKHRFLELFPIFKVTLNFSSRLILFTALTSYTRLDNNTLLNSHALKCILLHTDSVLIVPFSNLPLNVYLVFLVKSAITAKETRLNRKEIEITLGFVYTKYKV